MILKSVFLRSIGTSVHLFEEHLVEDAAIFIKCFVILVMILPDFYTTNEKFTMKTGYSSQWLGKTVVMGARYL